MYQFGKERNSILIYLVISTLLILAFVCITYVRVYLLAAKNWCIFFNMRRIIFLAVSRSIHTIFKLDSSLIIELPQTVNRSKLIYFTYFIYIYIYTFLDFVVYLIKPLKLMQLRVLNNDLILLSNINSGKTI